MSMKETAAIFGKAIGKPGLGYSQFPGFAVEMAMKQMGMSASFVKLMVEMNEAINTGWMKALEPRSAENTDSNFHRDICDRSFRARVPRQSRGRVNKARRN